MSFTLRKGLRYETLGRQYLEARGLQPLDSNFNSRYGEIDLVMLHGECVCFIEVRYRKSLDFGGAAASITPAKQRRIIRTAEFYLTRHSRLANRALRFDALLAQRTSHGELEYNWIQNAFYAE